MKDFLLNYLTVLLSILNTIMIPTSAYLAATWLKNKSKKDLEHFKLNLHKELLLAKKNIKFENWFYNELCLILSNLDFHIHYFYGYNSKISNDDFDEPEYERVFEINNEIKVLQSENSFHIPNEINNIIKDLTNVIDEIKKEAEKIYSEMYFAFLRDGRDKYQTKEIKSFCDNYKSICNSLDKTIKKRFGIK